MSTRRYCLDARSATHHFPGIGRYVSNLAREMAGLLAADESLLLLRDAFAPSPWPLPEDSPGVRLVDAPAPIFTFSQQWQIPRLLRSHDVHVFHSPYYVTPIFQLAPMVVTIHDLIPRLFPHYFSLRTRLLAKLFHKLAVSRAAAIIVDSETTRRDVLRAYSLPAARVTAVPLAADRIFQPPAATEIERVRRVYELPEKYVLYLGSNKPHKNLERLVAAYGLVAGREIGPPPLVIAGAWDARYPQARQRALALQMGPVVRFLGPVADADLPALYGGALFFVFPSIYEGFGLPVLEAMACGTAVACANTASLAEVGAEAVTYFDPRDVANMAATTTRLLHEEGTRAELSARGLARAAGFSWARTAADTLRQYRLLA